MQKIYLDYSATTPLSDLAFNAMKPYFSHVFANADSLYEWGRECAYAVDGARREIASLIGAKPEEIFFTSGGSESDNWALKGIAFANKDKGNHIITTQIEHPAIINTCKWLENNGFEVTYLPVDKYGLVNENDLKHAIKPQTILISVMFVNNEIGTIQPIKKLASIAKEKNVYFHTDAVQAIGYEDVNVSELNVDMISLSAHKFFGPKGLGVLYVKKGTRIDNLVHGGHQELAMRGGTTNTPLIVGTATALKNAISEKDKVRAKVEALRNRFEKRILNEIPNTYINGNSNRIAHNCSVTFVGVESSVLLFRLDMEGVFASAGSACSSGSIEPSHVLKAIGLSDVDAKSTLRFSFSMLTTVQEVDFAVDVIKKCVSSLRN
ncbi:MAG: cysteine desulfurase [Clostridiales bacterium]|nr:cysteine desulfurase [Clostridiales bacterium]